MHAIFNTIVEKESSPLCKQLVIDLVLSKQYAFELCKCRICPRHINAGKMDRRMKFVKIVSRAVVD